MVVLITFLHTYMERQWFTPGNHMFDLGAVVHQMSSTNSKVLIMERRKVKEK